MFAILINTFIHLFFNFLSKFIHTSYISLQFIYFLWDFLLFFWNNNSQLINGIKILQIRMLDSSFDLADLGLDIVADMTMDTLFEINKFKSD